MPDPPRPLFRALLEHPLARNRFVHYLAVGALNTVFGYSVFAGLFLLGVHYAIAALISTVLGVLFNFKTTGRFVFKTRESSLWRFVAMYAAMYVLGVLLLKLGKGLGIHELVTSAALILPMALLGYVLNKVFVFRPAGPSQISTMRPE